MPSQAVVQMGWNKVATAVGEVQSNQPISLTEQKPLATGRGVTNSILSHQGMGEDSLQRRTDRRKNPPPWGRNRKCPKSRIISIPMPLEEWSQAGVIGQSQKTFWLLLGRQDKGASVNWCVEVRDAPKHPTMHKAAPMTKNCLLKVSIVPG